MFTALVERKRKEGLVVYERLHYGKQIFPLVRPWYIKYIYCIFMYVNGFLGLKRFCFSSCWLQL